MLPGYDASLSDYARRALEQLGVEVALGDAVTKVTAGTSCFGGRCVDADTIIWAAGVRASPAAAWLGVAADRNGRIVIQPDLTVPGHPEIFAVGDTVAATAPTASRCRVSPLPPSKAAAMSQTSSEPGWTANPLRLRFVIITMAALRKLANARRSLTLAGSSSAVRPLGGFGV